MKLNGGNSVFSTGPSFDLTPEDGSSCHVPMADSSPITSSSYGPPYAIPPQADSAFSRLESKLSHKPGVTNPAGLAYKIGEEQLGKSEMTRRAVKGRKEHEG